MNIDFAVILVLLVATSGVIYLFDVVFLAPGRRGGVVGKASDLPEGEPKRPVIVEYARSFFPIFLIVLLLRSFLVEPFRIPSGSMIPTLLIGDFILVNKFTYGIRLPVLNAKVFELGSPKRGDVVVFRYPEDPSTPFIKRVVGLPGDRIGYADKTLRINGEPVEQAPRGVYDDGGSGAEADLRYETLGTTVHPILIERERPSLDSEVVVPEGHYFVMGDNRDNSRDSRSWGTVPDDHLIGKAFLIWMSWDSENTGIRWTRIGRYID